MQTYRAPRVHADLRVRGERHSRKRIDRLMLRRAWWAPAIGTAARQQPGGPAARSAEKRSVWLDASAGMDQP
jgi:hypothetical protein